MLLDGSASFYVTPEAGTKLRIILNSQSDNALVYLNNNYVETVTAGSGSHNILLVSNCSGGTYKVSIFCYATEYVYGYILSSSV